VTTSWYRCFQCSFSGGLPVILRRPGCSVARPGLRIPSERHDAPAGRTRPSGRLGRDALRPRPAPRVPDAPEAQPPQDAGRGRGRPKAAFAAITIVTSVTALL